MPKTIQQKIAHTKKKIELFQFVLKVISQKRQQDSKKEDQKILNNLEKILANSNE